jgi:DNA repair protein RecO (recombination protein O)
MKENAEHMEEKVEAIVLKAIPFKERDRIITLFSKEVGLLSLIIKNITKPHLFALSTPFASGEFLYRKGKSELFFFLDGTLLDNRCFLREDLSNCKAASSMAKALLEFHFPQSHVTKVYPLFISYLNQIPLFEKKETLVFSFLMKILLHEGILHLSSLCNVCKKQPASYLLSGESLCSLHKEQGALAFSAEEWKNLEILTYSRSFRLLKEINFSESLETKIAALFQQFS